MLQEKARQAKWKSTNWQVEGYSMMFFWVFYDKA